ncbi:thiazolinyl imide reductase [Peptostreptococcaceae bacterium oral taxon 113 str. W5053]|nr:thiazolinyl imide reductase [Peptostreptococcaceae bacterium oral taxon 113 str. W5053]
MIKAIVCGTTFGQSYINAIKKMDDIELVGILAFGSSRSEKCAKEHNVPLYIDVNSIPKNIDVAFVVVKSSVLGGKGTELAENLLKKGIHVMQEHPIHYKEIESCIKVARKFNVCYMVGNLYNSLKNIEKFIETAKYLNEKDVLQYIDIMTSSQLLYSLIGILNEALPLFRSLNVVSSLTERRYPFNRVVLSNGQLDINLQIHNEVSDVDGNNHMHILHKITFFYNSGRLELEDTFGSVIWRNRMSISDGIVLDSKKNENGYLDKLMQLVLKEYNSLTYAFLLYETFPNGIKKEIEKFIENIKQKRIDSTRTQKEILVAKKWGRIMEEIGFPQNVKFEETYFDHIPVLKKLRSEI